MNCAPIRQMNTARHIARAAQQQILNKTGLKIELLLYGENDIAKTPERMLRIIAIALEMSPECFRIKSRTRDITELRYIGAIFLRRNFPMMTLFQIATLFGGQDHTSVINGITRAYELINTGDTKFMNKYNKALNSVNLWLQKEVSGCA